MKYYTSIALLLLTVAVQRTYSGPQTDRSNMIDEKTDVFYYRPFSQESKIAVLKEKSALKFIHNLPYLDGATALYPVYSAFANAVYPRPSDSDSHYLNRANRSGAMIRGKVECSTTPFAYNNRYQWRC
jgi:phosphate transport system substrate-binding protein